MIHQLRGVLVFLTVVFSFHAWGEVEVPLVKILSSYPDKYSGAISVNVNEESGEVMRFEYRDTRGTHRRYSIEEITNGVVLLEAFNKNIVHLKAPGFDTFAGGELQITFLRNFLGSDLRQIRCQYSRTGAATEWGLEIDDQEGRSLFGVIDVRVGKSFGIPTKVKEVYLWTQSGPKQKLVRKYDPKDLPKPDPQDEEVLKVFPFSYSPVL